MSAVDVESVINSLCGCAPDCYERITCSVIGGLGHFNCGWCDIHESPRHRCGCVLIERIGS